MWSRTRPPRHSRGRAGTPSERNTAGADAASLECHRIHGIDHLERESIAEGLRAALRDLGEVFTELVQTAEEKSFLRCPYMNIHRECTAGFECINQVWTLKRERAICSGQHKINFCCGGDHAALARGAEPPTS